MLAHLLMSTLCLALAGCATWQAPTELDDSALRVRAEVQQLRGVKLSAAVLSKDDSQRIFGVNVNETRNTAGMDRSSKRHKSGSVAVALRS